MLLTYRPPIELALAWALLKPILSLWDSSLVDVKSRVTPEPTQILKNPKRYPHNEDTFFLLTEASRILSNCFGQPLHCGASPYKFRPAWTELTRHEQKASRR